MCLQRSNDITVLRCPNHHNEDPLRQRQLNDISALSNKPKDSENVD